MRGEVQGVGNAPEDLVGAEVGVEAEAWVGVVEVLVGIGVVEAWVEAEVEFVEVLVGIGVVEAWVEAEVGVESEALAGAEVVEASLEAEVEALAGAEAEFVEAWVVEVAGFEAEAWAETRAGFEVAGTSLESRPTLSAAEASPEAEAESVTAVASLEVGTSPEAAASPVTEPSLVELRQETQETQETQPPARSG